ncbi:bifunctional nitrate reductase/sulfite reductase flavoprotein subunit alpha [Gordonia caeni]|uniref:Bifunctional nitrate reductase/sulfite reductase flavoprotein subunit alpha n=1 Tax=Gordonia caeni TaxID=1007097 RepID=A0ABP7P337_9ACTN
MTQSTVETVCGYCGVGCGLTLQVADGAVSKVSGTAAHPANRGRLCTKGNTTADLLRAPGRLTTALRRTERGSALAPVDVDDEINRIAGRFTELRDEHGPDAVALYVSGQMSIEAQYLANKLAKGYLRTPLIESNSRLCMASAGTGYKQSLGADGPPGSYDDLDHADAFLVIGANMADCHPILFLRMMDRVKAGARLIVVDPRRTATAAKADLHLPVRPGTDLALLNGLLRLLVDDGAIDQDFIDEHTDGWPELAALLEDYPAGRVAEICGLSEDDLRTAARWLGEAGNWMSLWTMGLNQSIHGTWHTNALCNLHLATGTICRTGSGPFSLTGQPNAMGGREMGYMGPGLPGQRTALHPGDRAETETLWGLPSGTIPDTAGGGTIDLFEQLAEGTIKAVWIICTNPVVSVANRDTVIRALEKAEFVVVQDVYTDVETSAYADSVLPATLWTESAGVMVNSERSLTYTAPAVPAPGQARPDWQLISGVARAMGFTDGFDHADAAAVFDEITAFHNPRTGWDLRGVDHDRLRSGPVQWPAPPGSGARNPIRYRNDGVSQKLLRHPDGTVPRLAFATPNGRARFLARPYLPHAEQPDHDHPLLLTTGRLPHQWHTRTKTGRVPRLEKLNPSPFVELHPDDARAAGIDDGAPVDVVSRRGAVRVPARLTDDITPGLCFVPMHWGGDLQAVNAMTVDAVDPDSLQPEFKVCAVSIAPAPVEAEPAAPESAAPPVGDVLAGDALAGALGIGPAPMATSGEQAFLTGLVHGIRANPPVDALPTIPASAPLRDEVRDWAQGVLAGYFSRTEFAVDAGPPTRRVLVVWASQTGTTEEYAAECADALRADGLEVTLTEATHVGIDDLRGDVLFLVATTGDGDAPDGALALWDALGVAIASQVADLRYSVLGFGDSSYADFCGFARKLDARLEFLGATRMCPRASCEPDYEEQAARWLAAVRSALDPDNAENAETTTAAAPAVAEATAPGYSRKNPLRTRLLANDLLTAPGSAKQVRRFAFDLPAGSLEYAPGDALGIWPRNSTPTVAQWLAATGLDGGECVEVGGRSMPLAEALTCHLDITRITGDLVRFVNEHHHDDDLTALIADPTALADWSWGRQAFDLLHSHPVTAGAADWLAVLRPIQPRLYSISSSPLAHAGRVEITVSVVDFDGPHGHRSGVCSTFLSAADDDPEVPIFIQSNKYFAPPEDPAAPAVMIGPGTGVAPFRGFLHHRAATGASGDNWLLFGEQHRATDFYYRDELEQFRADGMLTRLDTAFSRDQDQKIYVQDLLLAQAEELWSWLQRGAHVYVCGDASRMARDVDDTLRRIIAEQGRLSPSAADAYVTALAAERRYVRDVY